MKATVFRRRSSLAYLLPTNELYGGIRLVIEQAERLARRGWVVELFAPTPVPDWHEVSVPWRQVDLAQPLDLRRFDVAVGTFYTTVSAVAASGVRLPVHFCQGFEGVHREYAPVLDQIEAVYRLPLPKFLVSAHLESVLRERFGARCHVIGQAVDHHLFRPPSSPRWPRLPTAQSPLRVGVVGPFGVRSKGIAEALEALTIARRSGLELVVVRASANPISEAERALNIVDEYHHRVPTRAMPNLYAGLDLLCYSSWDEEGFPLPPLEAMACGVPVILTDIGPFRVLPREAAVRVPFNDPLALAAAVVELAGQPDRRAELAAAGMAAIAPMTFDAMLDRLEHALALELRA